MAALARPLLNVRAFSNEQKVEETIQRGVSYLPGAAKAEFMSFLTPQSLGIMTATLLAWALAHVYGVGEATDLVLLVVGVGFTGWGFWQGLRDAVDCAVTALRATSERELDLAGQLFAKAVIELGINTLMALLLKRPLTSARARIGRITKMNWRPHLIDVGPPPNPGQTTQVVYNLASNVSGETDPYGNIKINGNLSAVEQAEALAHELGHRNCSPLAELFRHFRGNLNWSAYQRSVFLRYIEEVYCQSRAELDKLPQAGRNASGTRQAIVRGFKFPLNGAYRINVLDKGVAPTAVGSDIGTQSSFLGSLVIDGHHVTVWLEPIHQDSHAHR